MSSQRLPCLLLALLLCHDTFTACPWTFAVSAPPSAIRARAKSRALTVRIMNAGSALHVLDIISSEHSNPNWNLISLSAAWSRLVRVQHSINEHTKRHPCLPQLPKLTKQLLEKTPRLPSRAVTNMLWATTKLESAMPFPGLWATLADAVKRSEKPMTARSVASVFLAMAATNDADIEILMGLLKIMAGRLAAVVLDMNAQEVANMIWSVARLATKDFDSEALMSPLALLMGRVPHVVSAMNAQEVANFLEFAPILQSSQTVWHHWLDKFQL
ncbi:unnamed protein product [Effrenium voratum]|uniref:Uncharacterized protein n=1 Tax=Effrenium voratum TaxID=2562239 RepID=A0AA36J2I3_9DINO|nr:unnamed protein product [Effrenium voratum]CAJ1425590.1 unnamed protein product [Effrenium voratum]